MRVLVPGGDGFIGKHVCAELQKLGVEYDVVDMVNGYDICDFTILPRYYDAIILLAADLGRTIEMYRNNFRIYEWVAQQNGTHIVYASSAAVYRDGEAAMEQQTPAPPTLYGHSKLLGEIVIKATQESYTILRLANVFGEGEGNGAIDAFKRGEKTIYGTGLDIRDYVDVKTVAHAFVVAAMHPQKHRNETYNISSGIPMTTLFAFATHGEGVPKHTQAREFDTRYSLLINTKARSAGLLE